ncbi:hypothetical protein WOLCODRAFT_165820 [Wolfiporia cocos MD-104 SS10]|uniref:MFS general substrate transporter n=1 Tax=Wolfiporia cocos (strain MD-104) TaxID=742152 RepID=A0A2H3J4T2_WOLCO|nr:hypothetical protein WOLCODRAFT_165820 [Wolfiporia cocos MD-104 SS10]
MFRVDWIGAFLFMAGGIAVMLALNWGSTYGWNSARVIVCFVTGGFAYIIFLGFEHILERRSSLSSSVSTGNPSFWTQPMLSISIFRSLDISITQYATLVSGMVLIVMFYFVAVFMVIVAGRSASNAGVQLIYFAPGMGAGSLLQIRLIKQYRQPKYPIMLGSLVLTISLGLISMAVEKNNTGMIAGFMVMSGVGVGLSIGALAIHARFSQPAGKVAIVSALLLFSRSLGGTIGLAQCGAVLDAKVRQYVTSAVESGAIPDSAAIASSLASLGSLQNINSLPPAVQTIVRDAYRDGTRWAFISLIPWAALGFLGTLCLSNIKDSDAAPSDKEEIPVEVLEDTNISELPHHTQRSSETLRSA